MRKIKALYRPASPSSKPLLAAYKLEKQARKHAADLTVATRKNLASHIKNYRARTKNKAVAEGFESGMKQAAELLSELNEKHLQSLAELEINLVQLCLKVLKKIIGQEFTQQPALVIDLIKKVLAAQSEDKLLNVWISQQHAALSANLPFEIKTDPQLLPGNFRIELNTGQLLRDWHKQFSQIENQIISSLDSTHAA